MLPTLTVTCLLPLLAVIGRHPAAAGTGLYTGPYFKDPQTLNITVHKDSTAYLPCVVRQLGDKKVSWVRVISEDSDILTVGQYTFVNDERFSVFLSTDTWTLVIQFVQARDAGVYECQISTAPKMALRFRLNVIVPQVEIVGDTEKYVRRGSTARLECRVSSTVQLPDYIFWYHSGKRLLEHGNARLAISVSRAGDDINKSGEMSVTSVLVILYARLGDAGNYTCLPSNLPNATLRLHVLDGEHPAAMQTGSANALPFLPSSMLFMTILILILSLLSTADISSDVYSYYRKPAAPTGLLDEARAPTGTESPTARGCLMKEKNESTSVYHALNENKDVSYTMPVKSISLPNHVQCSENREVNVNDHYDILRSDTNGKTTYSVRRRLAMFFIRDYQLCYTQDITSFRPD